MTFLLVLNSLSLIADCLRCDNTPTIVVFFTFYIFLFPFFYSPFFILIPKISPPNTTTQTGMFRLSANKAVRKGLVNAPKRFMGASALNGNATSPHYADFGYGANQMLPFHELMKNPIPYRWVPRRPAPPMVAGHHPELHQHQTYTEATGHFISIVPGIDYRAEAIAKEDFRSRVKGGLSYLTIVGALFAYEVFMWDGLQFLQQPVWDELTEANYRVLAHSLQWERSIQEMLKETPMSEVYQIIQDRPFYQNNPYRFNDQDLKIADSNVSYRAFEPAIANMSEDVYRKNVNYVIFYTELSEKLASITDAKQMETELSSWLLNQTKFSLQELEEIGEFAKTMSPNFALHRNSVFDKEANQIVFFEGRHWAQVEENLKAPVPSLAETLSEKTAQNVSLQLLISLCRAGPNEYLGQVFAKDHEDADSRKAVWNFLTMDVVDEDKFQKLFKLAQQVKESSDNTVATYQANAQGLALPVPVDFSVAAINHALSKASV